MLLLLCLDFSSATATAQLKRRSQSVTERWGLAAHSSKANKQAGLVERKMLVTQSCLTLCDLMDCSPPGSSVHRILQARILEPVAISFSRRSSWPRDRAWVSCIAGGFFTIWATRQAQWKGKFALFQKLKTVQRPTPLTDNQWARAFRSWGRGYVKEQHSQLWSSWNWSSVVWPMSFWLF